MIEAGFAASSNGDFDAVKSIANAIKDSTVCSLARANDRDISRAAEALEGAKSKRIHTFIATSALHMEKKLRMSPEQVHEQAKLSVRFARQFTDDVEFSPEDGYRSEPDFLCRVLEAAIAEGATTINIPDTVGYAVPELYGQFLRMLRERVPNSDKAVWSVHCHNDLGMAVANSLAGVMIGGARQVECTINGLGERAGNCSLEEVVMAVRTRRDFFDLDVGIDTTQIVPGIKAGGGHYRLCGAAKQGGGWRECFRARVGHSSGRRAQGARYVRDHARRGCRLERQQDRAGQAVGPQRVQAARERAFDPARERNGIERRVCRLQGACRSQVRDFRRRHSGTVLRRGGDAARRAFQVDLDDAEVRNGSTAAREDRVLDRRRKSLGRVRWQRPGRCVVEGDREPRQSGCELLLYSVNAITTGTEAQGEVTVRLGRAGRIVNGTGADPDIIAASAKAYLNALNKLYMTGERLNPQTSLAA